ncbi:ATP-binding protein [Sporomusa aerivorans]|uniref:ATP-binding protein n=1 Tax=Sporomusa aerivorans TaxID=204936 RepID=UPI00352A32C1
MGLPRTKNSIAMTFVGICLLMVIAGLIVNYFNFQYKTIVAGERERLKDEATILDTYFNTKLIGLKLLANYQDVRSLETLRARRNLLEAAATLGVDNIALYDTKGKLICDCSSMPGYISAPFEDQRFRDAFQTVLTGKTAISGRMIYGGLTKAFISIHVPVIEENRVIAVLVAYIPLSDISMAIMKEGVPERQYFFVLDSHGQFLYHPHITELYPESQPLKEQMTGLVRKNVGIDEFTSPLDGIDKLIIYSELYNADWHVATTVPLASLYMRVLGKSLEDARSFFLLALCLALLYGVGYQAKRHERERERLKLERMTCVNQFAAGIAHEIRNPLTSIKGFIQLMSRRSDRPATPEHLEIILSEIGRIDNLISEFQMLARPLKEPEFQKVNICKLVEDVALLMEGQVHNKNITVRLQPSTADCFAVGDMPQLKQVFINLMKNAVEAAPFGGHINIAIDRQQNMLAVTVENNGDSIPQDIIEKLGTPFFTTKENGTGLGLSVCFSIVGNHGGKIKVLSQKDMGTVFTVLLPPATDDYVPVIL